MILQLRQIFTEPEEIPPRSLPLGKPYASHIRKLAEGFRFGSTQKGIAMFFPRLNVHSNPRTFVILACVAIMVGCEPGGQSPTSIPEKNTTNAQSDLIGCWSGDLRNSSTYISEEVFVDTGGKMNDDAVLGDFSINQDGVVTGDGTISKVMGNQSIVAMA